MEETLLTSLKWLARDRAGGMYRLCHAVSVRLRLMAPAAAFDERDGQTKLTLWAAQLAYTAATRAPVRGSNRGYHLQTNACVGC